MKRRIIKKGELVVDADSCIGKTIPNDPDEEEAEQDTRQIKFIRRKPKTPSRVESVKRVQLLAMQKKMTKRKPRVRGGQASDADTEASEETKFLPDKWLLTRDALIRVHNKPGKTFSPK